ncbi:WYL domain-containing protein [Lysinibacillus irui]|uniref:helix-turn-helix transcriptional regulator n=1 Tax=Lysinibacillus irui TaxID=2998077 RepID=UPI003888EC9B
MVDSQQSKGYRVLSMFNRLMDGHGINKKQEALTHQVGEKTIQRDIDQIRAYIAKAKLDCHLQYARSEKVYKLIHTNNNRLSKEQVLTIIKILIASKALVKSELSTIIEKLASNVQANKREQMVLNENHFDVDTYRKQSLIPLIWRISEAISKKIIIQIDYLHEDDITPTEIMLQPLTIIFSEYDFYLIAYDYHSKKDVPIAYQMDHIQDSRELTNKFYKPFTDHFQVEELHKRKPFMDAGELLPIRFLYKGKSPKTIFNRLPSAKLLSQNDSEYFFEAEVFGIGIKMWLLSQGATIEVLEPIELREEIIATIQAIQQNYRCI